MSDWQIDSLRDELREAEARADRAEQDYRTLRLGWQGQTARLKTMESQLDGCWKGRDRLADDIVTLKAALQRICDYHVGNEHEMAFALKQIAREALGLPVLSREQYVAEAKREHELSKDCWCKPTVETVE